MGIAPRVNNTTKKTKSTRHTANGHGNSESKRRQTPPNIPYKETFAGPEGSPGKS
jgi:hypothetical protein